MNDANIKYTQLERERRFLVTDLPDLTRCAFADIEDRYITNTRMRLRQVSHSDGRVVHKLCKKYEPISATTTPIVNIYLNAEEFEGLVELPATLLRKRRFYIETDDGRFALDQFKDELTGLLLCEAERETDEALEHMVLPGWVGEDVTHKTEYQGGNLHSVRTQLDGFPL